MTCIQSSRFGKSRQHFKYMNCPAPLLGIVCIRETHMTKLQHDDLSILASSENVVQQCSRVRFVQSTLHRGQRFSRDPRPKIRSIAHRYSRVGNKTLHQHRPPGSRGICDSYHIVMVAIKVITMIIKWND